MEIVLNEFGRSIDTSENNYKRLEVAGIGISVYINSRVKEIDITGTNNEIKLGPKGKCNKIRNMGSENRLTGFGVLSKDCEIYNCKNFERKNCICELDTCEDEDLEN